MPPSFPHALNPGPSILPANRRTKSHYFHPNPTVSTRTGVQFDRFGQRILCYLSQVRNIGTRDAALQREQ